MNRASGALVASSNEPTVSQFQRNYYLVQFTAPFLRGGRGGDTWRMICPLDLYQGDSPQSGRISHPASPPSRLRFFTSWASSKPPIRFPNHRNLFPGFPNQCDLSIFPLPYQTEPPRNQPWEEGKCTRHRITAMLATSTKTPPQPNSEHRSNQINNATDGVLATLTENFMEHSTMKRNKEQRNNETT